MVTDSPSVVAIVSSAVSQSEPFPICTKLTTIPDKFHNEPSRIARSSELSAETTTDSAQDKSNEGREEYLAERPESREVAQRAQGQAGYRGEIYFYSLRTTDTCERCCLLKRAVLFLHATNRTEHENWDPQRP